MRIAGARKSTLGFFVFLLGRPHSAARALPQGLLTHGANPSLAEIARLFFFNRTRQSNEEGEDSTAPPPQTISVVAAGLSRRGTSSLRAALDRVGYKSYHMKEGALETPGHLQLWHDYYLGDGSTGIDDVLDAMETDGYNATTDAPTYMHFARMLERNPNALVVLNLRKGGGQAWADGFLSSVHPIPSLLQRPPFRWSSIATMQGQFLEQVSSAMNITVDPATGLPDRDRMVESYERWVEHVRASVPSKQLLEYHVQDGWEPLCDFLSPASELVKAHCHQIEGSNEPFPHVNDGNFVRQVVGSMRIAVAFFEALPALLVAVLGLLVRRRVLLRPTSPGASKSKTV